MSIWKRKPLAQLLNEAADSEKGLKKTLTAPGLVALGIGAIIGAGSGVTGDVEAGKTLLGYPAIDAKDALRQWAILKRMVNDSKK